MMRNENIKVAAKGRKETMHSSVIEPPGVSKAVKRFNLDLTAEAYQDMENLARMSGGRSKGEVFRLALSLLNMIYPAILRGEELCLVDRQSNKETRILVPR